MSARVPGSPVMYSAPISMGYSPQRALSPVMTPIAPVSPVVMKVPFARASSPVRPGGARIGAGGHYGYVAAPASPAQVVGRRPIAASVAIQPAGSPAVRYPGLVSASSPPVSARQLVRGGQPGHVTITRASAGGTSYATASRSPQVSVVRAVNGGLGGSVRGVQYYGGSTASNAVANPEQTIRNMLEDRDVLKKSVIRCYRAVIGNSDGIDIPGLVRFRGLFLQEHGIPASVLNELEAESVRFDFSGNGRLEMNEVYKLVKFHLREWLKKHGRSKEFQVSVPMKTPQSAGYMVRKQLGKGSQGLVMLATDRQGKEVCLKTYAKRDMNALAFEDLKDEFDTMQLLACERLARAFEIFQDYQSYYLACEAYYGGDMTNLRPKAQQNRVPMTEDWWRIIFKQCFEALAFMHEQAMMHCDIKEANMMLKTTDYRNPEVVLIDFGVSKAMAKSSDGLCGTPGYIPPETWEQQKWFPRGDVFSMGVCVMQLLTDKLPPEGQRFAWSKGGIFLEGALTLPDIAQATKTRTPPFHLMPREYPALTRLTQALLSKQLRNRPTPQQVLEDAWFQPGRAPAVSSRAPAAVSVNDQLRRGVNFKPAVQENGKAKAGDPPQGRAGRHAFATVGITQSFIKRMDAKDDDDDENDSPQAAAAEALAEVVRETRLIEESGSTAESLVGDGGNSNTRLSMDSASPLNPDEA
eukprot:TRINITY_DN8124_c0_g1_i1.p1 TRINITY_DN8124_c0_g1~~TRINITY_DN8124_c0_g1_i1.p1  ORF type:complete len:694 (+),score=156.31 TRINITY_DN8124_c0_g1_i1:77-2158(+)